MPETSGQPPDIGQQLDELAVKIERVKQLYEQYFMGIEKIEPLVPRKEVTRAMLLLQQHYIRNTGLRFKFNTMLQKWNIYVTYWNRTLREIENGTYIRHVARMKRKGMPVPDEMKSRAPEPPPAPPFPPAPPASVAPAAPPPIPQAAKPRSITPVPEVPGLDESELRALHRKFLDARRTSGESQVSYEALVQSIARQVGKVLEQPGVRSVRFDVAVQNGRAVLKAIPKK